jgi:hypothetical protein
MNNIDRIRKEMDKLHNFMMIPHLTIFRLNALAYLLLENPTRIQRLYDQTGPWASMLENHMKEVNG